MKRRKNGSQRYVIIMIGREICQRGTNNICRQSGKTTRETAHRKTDKDKRGSNGSGETRESEKGKVNASNKIPETEKGEAGEKNTRTTNRKPKGVSRRSHTKIRKQEHKKEKHARGTLLVMRLIASAPSSCSLQKAHQIIALATFLQRVGRLRREATPESSTETSSA